MLEGFAFVLTISGYVSVFVVLWVLSLPIRLSASEVFQTFSDDGGWGSLGLSMVAGQILLVWTLTGKRVAATADQELNVLRLGFDCPHGGGNSRGL